MGNKVTFTAQVGITLTRRVEGEYSDKKVIEEQQTKILLSDGSSSSKEVLGEIKTIIERMLRSGKDILETKDGIFIKNEELTETEIKI